MDDSYAENKIRLRAPEPEDLELLYTWENDQNIWQVSNTLVPFSRHILKKYLDNAHLDIYQAKQLRLMIDRGIGDDRQETVGAIDLFDFDPFHLRAGVGILIYNDKNKNQGLATAALKELISYAFSSLQLHQLYCNVASDNQASIRVFRKVGFEIVGTKKEWLKRPDGYTDEVLMQLITHNTMINS